MSTPIQDFMLQTLVTAAIGGFVGAVLSGWLRARRRGFAGNGESQFTRWDEARTAPVPVEPRRWPWQRPEVPPPAADLLVVDDSAVARLKLRRLFEGAGYDIHLASDGAEALARLQVGRYALMLTDLEMPIMDGATLIDRCRRLPHTARMPILAITGHENLRLKFNECRDISGVHRKPWVDDILLSHVAALAGVRHPDPYPAPGITRGTVPRRAAAKATRPADLIAR